MTDGAPTGPTLTDGTVTLVPFDERHIDRHVAGEDDEARLWFGQPGPSTYDGMLEVVERWRREREAGSRLTFAIRHDDEGVGFAEARMSGRTASLSWLLYAGHRGHGYAVRAVRLLVEHCFDELGAQRVEAEVDPRNRASLRVATRAGLLREGIRRCVPGMADRPDATGMVVLARLTTDLPVTEPEGFRVLLNSFLPRKRAIGQLLVRDEEDRVLLCQLTYKRDWDLPGGVVEVGESPKLAVAREVQEELALTIAPGALLLTDWLPPWSGWDDALCLVFDGGVQAAAIVAEIVHEQREIKNAEFCDADQVAERCADFTARRIASALANLAGAGPDDGSGPRPAYVESGGPLSI